MNEPFTYYKDYQIHFTNDAWDVYAPNLIKYEFGECFNWDGQAVAEGLSTLADAYQTIVQDIVDEKFLDKWVR